MRRSSARLEAGPLRRGSQIHWGCDRSCVRGDFGWARALVCSFTTERTEPGKAPVAMTSLSFAAIVLNYNYAAFVADAVESVLKQSRPFDEVIVVNDGSTDNSLEVLEAYADRARVLDIPNGGQF